MKLKLILTSLCCCLSFFTFAQLQVEIGISNQTVTIKFSNRFDSPLCIIHPRTIDKEPNKSYMNFHYLDKENKDIYKYLYTGVPGTNACKNMVFIKPGETSLVRYHLKGVVFDTTLLHQLAKIKIFIQVMYASKINADKIDEVKTSRKTIEIKTTDLTPLSFIMIDENMNPCNDPVN